MQLPFLRGNSNAVVSGTEWMAKVSECLNPHRRYPPLHAIEPNCELHFLRGINGLKKYCTVHALTWRIPKASSLT